MAAEWRLTRFPGYWVSDEGQVRGPQGRILRPGATGRYKEYLQVSCGRGNSQRVHVLVAEAFFGPCPPGMEVAHENGVGSDNRVQNLSYKTKVQNEADKVRHGTAQRRGALGERNSHSVLSPDQVVEIRRRPFPVNISHLASEFGVSRRTIKQIITGETWGHLA